MMGAPRGTGRPTGRPPREGDRVRTTLDVPVDLLARIDQEAHDRDVSRNKVITWCLERGLPLLVPIDTLTRGPTDVTTKPDHSAPLTRLPNTVNEHIARDG